MKKKVMKKNINKKGDKVQLLLKSMWSVGVHRHFEWGHGCEGNN